MVLTNPCWLLPAPLLILPTRVLKSFQGGSNGARRWCLTTSPFHEVCKSIVHNRFSCPCLDFTDSEKSHIPLHGVSISKQDVLEGWLLSGHQKAQVSGIRVLCLKWTDLVSRLKLTVSPKRWNQSMIFKDLSPGLRDGNRENGGDWVIAQTEWRFHVGLQVWCFHLCINKVSCHGDSDPTWTQLNLGQE